MRVRAFAFCLTALIAGSKDPASSSIAAQQQPTFRATTNTVTVNVSVKRGNNTVANLTAADFRLTDNGVPQTVEAVSIESVPIDVTLFLDTSGSTAGKLDEMQKDIQTIVKFLRKGDRLRLLTIGDSVYQPVPWVDAGTEIKSSFTAVGGISLIHDALMIGLVHRPDPGRRHLIVGMTDRQDCGSVIPASMLLELAGRSDALLHLVDYSGGGGAADYRVRGCTPRARPGGVAMIEEAAARTGGELKKQSRWFRVASLSRAFKPIFDDFRQSYVLRYQPANVPGRGWHTLTVTVPKVSSAIIRARQGYYAD